MTVSILLATRNRPLMVPFAIASVLAQSDPDWELVVLDNGDSIANLIPADRRVRYVHTKASGPADAYQQALAFSTGEIVMPLGDDDQLTNKAVKVIHDRIGDAEWGYARTAWQRDGETIYLLGAPWDIEVLKKGYYLGAVFWRRTLSDRLGGFDSEFDGAADYELYLRFGIETPPVYIRDQILYLYNDWDGTDSRVKAERQWEANQKIQAKYK